MFSEGEIVARGHFRLVGRLILVVTYLRDSSYVKLLCSYEIQGIVLVLQLFGNHLHHSLKLISCNQIGLFNIRACQQFVKQALFSVKTSRIVIGIGRLPHQHVIELLLHLRQVLLQLQVLSLQHLLLALACL